VYAIIDFYAITIPKGDIRMI